LRKTPIFFAENWQKSQKIVIITSTPRRPAPCDKEQQKSWVFGRPDSSNPYEGLLSRTDVRFVLVNLNSETFFHVINKITSQILQKTLADSVARWYIYLHTKKPNFTGPRNGKCW
jgi:hypothetical protein